MKKLRLQLEDLRIDSFQTTPVQRVKGTVRGEEDPCTCPTRCATCTCPDCNTCWESCNGSCYESCNGTCGGGETCDESCINTCFVSCGDIGFTCLDTCTQGVPTDNDGINCT